MYRARYFDHLESNLYFLERHYKSLQYKISLKYVDALIPADRRKDMTKLTATFRDDANRLKSAAMQFNMEDIFTYRFINHSM